MAQRFVDIHGKRSSASINKRRREVIEVAGQHRRNSASSEIGLTILKGLGSTFSFHGSNVRAGQSLLHRRSRRWHPQEGKEEGGDNSHRWGASCRYMLG